MGEALKQGKDKMRLIANYVIREPIYLSVRIQDIPSFYLHIMVILPVFDIYAVYDLVLTLNKSNRELMTILKKQCFYDN